jgi:hypothetical protein
MGSTTATEQGRMILAFVQRLRELGWIGNRTVAIEYRWAEGCDERFAEIAAEFVMFHTGSPNSVLEMGEAQSAARTLGLGVVTSEDRRVEEISRPCSTRSRAAHVASPAIIVKSRSGHSFPGTMIGPIQG